MLKIMAASLFFLVSLPAFASGALLRVEVTSAKDSGLCAECAREVLWPSWRDYEANVTGVLDGSYTGKTIRFAIPQHADYPRAVLKDVYVVISPAPAWLEKNTGIKYQALDLSIPRQVVCLNKDAVSELSDRIRKENSFAGGCYFAGSLAP